MKKALLIIIAFMAIFATAGCFNFAYTSGFGFYWFAGLANLVGTGYLIYKDWKEAK